MADRAMSPRERTGRTIVLVVAYLAVAHFSFGLYLTSRLMIGSDCPTSYVWFVLPYVGITGVFLLSIVLAHSNRLRWSALALVVGLLLSVSACVYDFANHRYQLTGGGIGPTYTMWWWYYEPFWYGYEPGNL
ncbi:MAG: hypothetical protein ACE5I3_12545 [Phycisphaerae bacterium]